MKNLNDPSTRKELEKQISDEINTYCQSYYKSDHRDHLGASELGEECWRKLWYGFRWTKLDKHDGRILRLFNVGHAAEPRFINYLEGIGFEFYKEPIRISGAKGHYGGTLDGMAVSPYSDQLILTEFKTNGTGKGFTDVENGLQKAKPKHFAQMSQYGYKAAIKYGLYLIENKNDSDIIVKLVELDWNLGAELEKKAETIIFAKEPPPRISENPTYFNCKYCHQVEICHKGAMPEKNCRSCRHSEPIDNAEWKCNSYNSIIPKDFIRQGCDSWTPIT
jgi:hypothetical protein